MLDHILKIDEFQSQLAEYRRQHSTKGCRITHMIGVPLIALSIPVSFFNKRLATGMFVIGWIFQFIGHIVYQHNRPMFMTEMRSPATILAALTFVTEEWIQFLDEASRKSVEPLNEPNTYDLG
ncbi:MAG: DUF962 domain-containing protein [Candidatus Obscuribacterales bacterium]|nr:DUF962 domain-containing protein [Candidatus Obscuribacterales bacterium]